MDGPAVAEGVDVAVARAVWAAGDTVIDVRTPAEYALGHLPGAVNVPIEQLPSLATSLPAGQLVTTCSAGYRAERGAHRLAALGRDALWIRGGVKAWLAAGLPVVTGPAPGDRPRHRSGLFALVRRLINRHTNLATARPDLVAEPTDRHRPGRAEVGPVSPWPPDPDPDR